MLPLALLTFARKRLLSLAVWLHDGEPKWYLHRQQTLVGRFYNRLARFYANWNGVI